ncbi:nuclear transport factor 2 family protein [Streptomonospora wellingtoniae]|uniref:Nuclear transport factor 2 family protein n=1 Tax=Streptomonospora wellingtoniae TaxID=3075544 RepID=A0ABU2KU02_9ACTN|nr:nuclear transport factor 2 family protein [Streptomonospora sp. DSM 45055]MDT0302780.1 nuclear transport factor 2 family protein [Streptomonospora sp. DSM 45055]
MVTAHSPAAELARRSVRLLTANDFAAWVDLWADDGVLEFPFAPAGWPRRLEGRAAIADYMSGYGDHIEIQDIPRLEIHRTTDPATAVVEMHSTGRLVRTGAPFEADYIMVLAVAGGRIAHARDYWNPLMLSSDGGAADFLQGSR